MLYDFENSMRSAVCAISAIKDHIMHIHAFQVIDSDRQIIDQFKCACEDMESRVYQLTARESDPDVSNVLDSIQTCYNSANELMVQSGLFDRHRNSNFRDLEQVWQRGANRHHKRGIYLCLDQILEWTSKYPRVKSEYEEKSKQNEIVRQRMMEDWSIYKA